MENKESSIQKLAFGGSGDLSGGDPRSCAYDNILAQNILIACRREGRTAGEVGEMLKVAPVFIENEFEIMAKSGLMKKLPDGRYRTDFIIFDISARKQAFDRMSQVFDEFEEKFITLLKKNEQRIMNVKYLAPPKSFGFVLWTLLPIIADRFNVCICDAISTQFAQEGINIALKKKFNVQGYIVSDIKSSLTEYGLYASNTTRLQNVFGWKTADFFNYSGRRLPSRFWAHAKLNRDEEYMLMLQAIHPMPVSSLSAEELETAARAIARGLVRKENGRIIPNMLVFDKHAFTKILSIADDFEKFFRPYAAKLGEEYAFFFKKEVPEHLYGYVRVAASILLYNIIGIFYERMIEQKLLYIPSMDGCAEGCYVIVTK